MKRLRGFVMLAGVLGAAWVLFGCRTTPAPAPGAVENRVEVDFYFHPGKPPMQKFVKIDGHPTVLQVTRRAAEVRTEITPTGDEWIVRIGKYTGSTRAGTLWTYELNNDVPKSAPNLVHVSAGDVIRWRLR
jgi:hypothetical protein